MKKFFSILLLLTGCTSSPKYKVGDCIHMGTLAVENGIMQSWGYDIASFKVIAIIDKVTNKYMNKSYTSKRYYVLKNNEYEKDKLVFNNLLLPISDLDNFTYATKYWEAESKNGCNSYEIPSK